MGILPDNEGKSELDLEWLGMAPSSETAHQGAELTARRASSTIGPLTRELRLRLGHVSLL